MGAVVLRIDRARLHGADPGADLAGLAVDDNDWLDVPVPGDVRDALRAAGSIADPHRDASDTASAWVDEKEWWYRFALPVVDDLADDESLVLRLDGVDTFATVYVDGTARHENTNMFRSAEIDVTSDLARPGRHVVAVRIRRPIDHIGGRNDLADRYGARVLIRKAQFGYGWDFAPYLPSLGLWRPVTLLRRKRSYIEAVHFQTLRLDPDGERAVVAIEVSVRSLGEKTEDDEVLISLASADGHDVLVATAPVRQGRAAVAGVIEQPELWWPAGHGGPALHPLQVELRSGGQTVASHHSRVGIRTVRLDESPNPDELGRRFFRFVVNGRTLLAKGANWIPAHTAVGTVTEDHYRPVLSAAVGANMNMVRVWGGGVYEHDAFYDLCDEMGLLVWQEFMFACAPYPDDSDAWREDIRAEATEQVRRLRSHPCLALWCGNNEVEAINSYLGPQKDRSSGANIFYDVLGEVVAREDGQIGYIASSPLLGNDMDQADRHNWDVWHGLARLQETGDFQKARAEIAARGSLDPDSVEGRAWSNATTASQYLDDYSPFPSEFGLLSYPVRETLAGWVEDDDLVLGSAQITGRNRDRAGAVNKLELAIYPVAGPVRNLDELIELGQLTQAEGLKLGLEHYRRRWPHCAGSLIWQLNDCWPGASWSLIDFAGRPKAAYFYVRRCYAPVLASFRPEADGGVSLWVSNDTDQAVADDLFVRLVPLAGGPDQWSTRLAVTAPAWSSAPVAVWSASELPAGADRALLVRSASETMANRHLFVAPRDLERPKPSLSVTHGQGPDGRVTVKFAASHYTLSAHVVTADPTVAFDDNYVDLEAGEVRTLTSLLPTTATAADLRVGWF